MRLWAENAGLWVARGALGCSQAASKIVTSAAITIANLIGTPPVAAPCDMHAAPFARSGRDSRDCASSPLFRIAP